MSARVINKMGMDEDPTNILLMHAVGANVSGQIASVLAGGSSWRSLQNDRRQDPDASGFHTITQAAAA